MRRPSWNNPSFVAAISCNVASRCWSVARSVAVDGATSPGDHDFSYALEGNVLGNSYVSTPLDSAFTWSPAGPSCGPDHDPIGESSPFFDNLHPSVLAGVPRCPYPLTSLWTIPCAPRFTVSAFHDVLIINHEYVVLRGLLPLLSKNSTFRYFKNFLGRTKRHAHPYKHARQ